MKQITRFMLLVGLVTLWGVSPAWSDDRPQGDGRAGLTAVDADSIFSACKVAAGKEHSAPGLRPNNTIMWCAVVDREGRLLLIQATDTDEAPGPVLRSDAWRGSIEIAIAKAYTGLAFSSNEQALTSRAIGALARTDLGFPTAPLFGIGNTNPYRPLIGSPSLNPDDSKGGKHHGIVTFPGGVPVYDCSTKLLLGA